MVRILKAQNMQLDSLVVVVTMGLALVFLMLALGHFGVRIGKRYKDKFVGRVDFALPQLFLFSNADRLLFVNIGVCILSVGFTWWLTQSLVPSVIVAIACGALPAATLAWLKKKRVTNLAQQFPEFVSLLAGSLRAGSSLNLALGVVALELAEPLRQEVGLLLREQKLGLAMDDSLANFSQRIPLEDFQLLCAAVRISRSSGGNLADALESLANSSRRKLAIEGKIQSLTAQGKLQGWVMAALPFVLGLALFQIEPKAMQPLVTTWYGWLVVGTVMTLQLVGLHFIRRIIRIDV
jgi:tight adherence protein B